MLAWEACIAGQALGGAWAHIRVKGCCTPTLFFQNSKIPKFSIFLLPRWEGSLGCALWVALGAKFIKFDKFDCLLQPPKRVRQVAVSKFIKIM